jgi:hypothetical protein
VLILLSPDLEAHLEHLLKVVAFRESLDNLAIAHRKGVHLVSGPTRLLRALGRALQGDAGGTFRHIAGKHHEQASLIALVSDYVLVEQRASGAITHDLVAGRTVHRVPYPYFAMQSAAQPSRLIAEDADDRDVYVRVLDAYVFHERKALHALRSRLQGFGGGGSSTEDQFRDHAHAGPTLAVVDSDRRAPDAATGSTASGVLRVEREISDDCVAAVELLPCHEMENMIPRGLLSNCLVAQDGADVRRRWLAVCDLGLLDGSREVRSLDLKRGVRRWDLVHCDHERELFYLECWTATRTIAECADSSACTSRDACVCVYADGLGDGAVKRVARTLTTLTPQKIAEHFFSQGCGTRQLWTTLSRRLFSWSCAPKPLRA